MNFKKMDVRILLFCTLGSLVSCDDHSNAIYDASDFGSSSNSSESFEGQTEFPNLVLAFPQTIANIKKLHFMLYTRRNKENPYEMKLDDKPNLMGSPFSKYLPTKVIIHGWQSSYNSEHIQTLKNALLDTYDANILLFDYEKYNHPYITAVLRSESIGNKFAEFLQFLLSQQALRPESVHIIGHSLGGHIAGFVGKNIYPRIARITALDPAGPFFFDRKPKHRLSKTDALYVDVIHTSTLAGFNEPIGTADFFANGGSKQPMCLTSPIVGGCDHLAGFKYYETTLINRNAYPARRCGTETEARISDPRENPCIPTKAVMGEDAIYRSPPGIYYVPVE